MPLYDILNRETGQIEEKMMTVAEYEQYKIDNPNHQQVFTDMRFIDEVRIGRKKPPKDFQEGVIDRIKRNNPGHNIQSRWD